MKRILVIGGYGGFGARLTLRLLAAGHHVLVAGRSGERASAFCDGRANATPVELDRNGDVAAAIREHIPDLVIDAAGPFQASSYVVPQACIAERVGYLDLADGRAFVSGIGALDGAARAAGVAVISGASSVPALSGAVTRVLARGLDRCDSLEIAISGSNRASAGVSVARAILSYVGKPISLWRGKRWSVAHGWQEMRRERFTVRGRLALSGRLVALADVPDHDIAPASLPGRPATVFRAGTELGFQMRALWLASWPVRWGWETMLTASSRWLLALYRLTLGMGGDRSAMSIVLRGTVGDRRVERRWGLIASDGHGPEIPTLAAALLAEDALSNTLVPGARHAWSALDLDSFAPLFETLSIRHEIVERVLPQPLYARVMGDRFEQLPVVVRAIHQVNGDAGARGQGTVVRGRNPLARLAGAITRMPPSGASAVHVAFTERDGVETWTRAFGDHRFSSELTQSGGLLVERFGPLRFMFDLPSDRHGLRMVLRGWSVIGIPLPRALAPRIEAREWQDDERFRFHGRVAAPLAGEIVRYEGWLVPTD